MSRINESFRFFSLLDGLTITNEDVTGNPEFFGYTGPGGRWVIMQHNTTTNAYSFALGVDLDRSLTNYDSAWANRSTGTGFARAGTYKDL